MEEAISNNPIEEARRYVANAEEIIQFILNSHVTGKANATMVTGGTTEYIISDENGNYLAALELYEGLLVRNDGMYHLSR